jgi:hypothetical protein
MSLDYSRKAVKLGRIVNEDPPERGVSGPFAEKIEQARIIRLALLLRGLWRGF